MNRRKLLRLLGTGGIVSTAGCVSMPATGARNTDSPTPVDCSEVKTVSVDTNCIDQGTEEPDRTPRVFENSSFSVTNTNGSGIEVRRDSFVMGYIPDEPIVEVVVGPPLEGDTEPHTVNIVNDIDVSREVALSVQTGGTESSLVFEGEGVLDSKDAFFVVVIRTNEEYSFTLQARDDTNSFQRTFSVGPDAPMETDSYHGVRIASNGIRISNLALY